MIAQRAGQIHEAGPENEAKLIVENASKIIKENRASTLNIITSTL